MRKLPVVIFTPHASGHVPYDVLADMLGQEVRDIATRQRRLRDLFDEGDPHTDAIFHAPGAFHLEALTSRFVVDLNRRRDEEGRNGVIKLTDFNERPLYPGGYRLSREAAEHRLAVYWDSYHRSVEGVLGRDDVLFFVDGHSMVPVGPRIGPDCGQPRPALCIFTGGDTEGRPKGSNHTSLSPETAKRVVKGLETHFADVMAQQSKVIGEVWLNRPFSLGGIQQRYSDPTRPFHKPGFGLEINRALYLEADGEPILGRIERLNDAFNAFLLEAVEVIKDERAKNALSASSR